MMVLSIENMMRKRFNVIYPDFVEQLQKTPRIQTAGNSVCMLVKINIPLKTEFSILKVNMSTIEKRRQKR